MKQIILSLLAPVVIGGMFTSAFAQNEAEPCCAIIAMDVQKNLVIARDHTTGRLYQFKTDALDIKAIKKGDAVNISVGKVSSISGAKRMYATVRPHYGEPCCNVVNIQPDPAEPCCNAVSFTNNTTNNTSSISVPKRIAATLKTGQAVSMDGATGMAVVQSSYGGSTGQMNSYGYPATSTDATTGNENEAEKWVINKVNAKSGTGKLFVDLPKGAEWDMTIYAAGSNKVLSNTMLQQSFSLLPGSYDLEVNKIWIKGVPVEKGNNTRLKTGVLHITNSTSWILYDEAKQTVLVSSMSPQKRGLPVGKYKLTILGQDQDIEIKDGETVEL